MRIKVGHGVGSITGATRVFMDGRELRHVFEADDFAGWAVVADVDDSGRLMVNPHDHIVVCRRLYGSIRFKFNMRRIPEFLRHHVAREIQ